MSLYHKAKRVAKLGVACAIAYYCAKACTEIALANEQPYYRGTCIDDQCITERDSIRAMGNQIIR